MLIEFDPTIAKLKLAFGYKKELVDAIKELPDRQYNPNDKTWAIGFDSSNLGAILAMLAGNNWPQDQLDKAETACKEYLATFGAETSEFEFSEAIKPPIIRLGELVVDAYVRGDITQAEQIGMLNILNHISIKDFIK